MQLYYYSYIKSKTGVNKMTVKNLTLKQNLSEKLALNFDRLAKKHLYSKTRTFSHCF